tara:strand:- start:118 stop:1101 length:984 start_codon:yes stop_codon:yes gene_type:complete
MPRNVYFSQAVKSEQNLYEDLIIESLKIFGQDAYYLPRTIINRDEIFGEDSSSKFDDAYMIEAYIENSDGFEGEGDLYSKFGLEIRDEATFIISRRQWQRFIGINYSNTTYPKPDEGDLIYLPLSNSFFEIKFVEEEQPFYQLSNLPVYKLNCALFEYNDEDMETGVAAIDLTQAKNAYQVGLDVAVSNGNHFTLGEIVTQTLLSDSTGYVTVFGEVQTITKSTDNTTAIISVSNIGTVDTTNESTTTDSARDFLVSSGSAGFSANLVGSTSTHTCAITNVYTLSDDDLNNTFASDSQAKNVQFEIEGDNFIDFSESNPFGDPSETL